MPGARLRLFGRPSLDELTREELEYNIIRLENENCEQFRVIHEFCMTVPEDFKWPSGIGYWDGITRAENEREGKRRRKARI